VPGQGTTAWSCACSKAAGEQGHSAVLGGSRRNGVLDKGRGSEHNGALRGACQGGGQRRRKRRRSFGLHGHGGPAAARDGGTSDFTCIGCATGCKRRARLRWSCAREKLSGGATDRSSSPTVVKEEEKMETVADVGFYRRGRGWRGDQLGHAGACAGSTARAWPSHVRRRRGGQAEAEHAGCTVAVHPFSYFTKLLPKSCRNLKKSKNKSCSF
jgi:hypothetical protein